MTAIKGFITFVPGFNIIKQFFLRLRSFGQIRSRINPLQACIAHLSGDNLKGAPPLGQVLALHAVLD